MDNIYQDMLHLYEWLLCSYERGPGTPMLLRILNTIHIHYPQYMRYNLSNCNLKFYYFFVKYLELNIPLNSIASTNNNMLLCVFVVLNELGTLA
jgi:hypothetical protein